ACLDIFPQRSTFFTYSFSVDMKPTPLCSNHFAVFYSKVSKTPLVSIEKLNAYSIADAKGEERTNNFYPDPRLKAEDRASLADYERSGFDRGH
ncbi:DNA/RNA non-specific endonuclease, partial [Klebsiella pneumoniae]|uniref:DNA/RNA non-specific endonuclease n=1 Tax=Klebsiella pneumoniae TaxID=573 RepID=UPI00200CE2EB